MPVSMFSSLVNRTVLASDGEVGHLSDIFFDACNYRVRYFVVHCGSWLFGRKVLVSTEEFIGFGEDLLEPLRLAMNKDAIEASLPVNLQAPLSRAYEHRPHTGQGWQTYWHVPAQFGLTMPHPEWAYPTEYAVPTELSSGWRERSGEMSQHGRKILRMDALQGYRINALDEVFGELTDFIIDDDHWQVLDLIVATRRYLPGGREVICSPLFVSEFDEHARQVHLEITKSAVVDQPQFSFDHYNAAYRAKMIEHFVKISNDDHQPSTGEANAIAR